MGFTFKKRNKRTRKRINCLLEYDTSAQIRSLQTCTVISARRQGIDFSSVVILTIPHVVKFTKVLTTVKDGLIRYNNTKTSCNGVNSMWIVKNSTSLLSSLDQLDVRTATSVQTYDYSTLYTSIPHNLLKSRITALIHNSFKK